jgi:deazaflavin-dependent oxidoreductase (nitroreductase family)
VDSLDLTDRAWPILRHLIGGHAAVYRASHRVPGMPPTLLLDHVGAKSGAKRTSPLAYLRDGENVVLVASKGGYPKNPAWFYNLRANPETTVQVGSERRPVRARVANPEERARLWPRVVDAYAGYDDYQRRTGREIPLVILERRTS